MTAILPLSSFLLELRLEVIVISGSHIGQVSGVTEFDIVIGVTQSIITVEDIQTLPISQQNGARW